jgi:hypothetical protein
MVAVCHNDRMPQSEVVLVQLKSIIDGLAPNSTKQQCLLQPWHMHETAQLYGTCSMLRPAQTHTNSKQLPLDRIAFTVQPPHTES